MDANVRELKAQLSRYLRKVEAGASVTVRVRNRAVARLVPVRTARPLADLARMPRGVSLAAWVAEDRR